MGEKRRHYRFVYPGVVFETHMYETDLNAAIINPDVRYLRILDAETNLTTNVNLDATLLIEELAD